MDTYFLAGKADGCYQRDGIRYDLRRLLAGRKVDGSSGDRTEAETEEAAAQNLGLAPVEITADALSAEKQRRLDQLNAAYQASLARGISVNGINLAATEADQVQFTKLSVLLESIERQLSSQEAKEAFLASQQTIVDLAGQPYTMSVSDLRVLLVAYGQAVAAKWQQLAVARAAIAGATN